MSPKTSGRIVGSMLLLAFVLYGGGSLLAGSVTGDPVVLADVGGGGSRLSAGVLLMLLNSGVVITIGVAAHPVLRRHHPLTADAYLLAENRGQLRPSQPGRLGWPDFARGTVLSECTPMRVRSARRGQGMTSFPPDTPLTRRTAHRGSAMACLTSVVRRDSR